MEAFERRKIQNAIDSIGICIQELKFQVLNNVDAHMEQTETDAAAQKSVTVFVKTPIVKCINRLTSQKESLMKVLRDSQLHETAEQAPQPQPQVALKEASTCQAGQVQVVQ